jgi:hypothetical protein
MGECENQDWRKKRISLEYCWKQSVTQPKCQFMSQNKPMTGQKALTTI